MNFREATDFLFEGVDHARLAKELGVSIATVRQARLKPTAGAHRSPPAHWKEGVAKLAVAQMAHYRLLLEALDASIFAIDNWSKYEGDNDANRAVGLSACNTEKKFSESIEDRYKKA
jgi:hypothetical protein